jgi:zinc/manganese transport system permease protein
MTTFITGCIITEKTSTLAMFEYDFVINAFAASGIAAILAGAVGYFLVMRGQTFAGHALSHVGFAGATGGGLLGLDPLWGMFAVTLACGFGMGTLGERIGNRDVAIGIVLSLALGCGLLFLHYHASFAGQATALLFGNVLAVERSTIAVLAGIAAAALIALAATMRPLVFASLQPELAEAKGVPLRFVSTAFLAIVAIAVSECAQIVGVLLVFTLMVAPPAAAIRLTMRLWSGIALSVGLALAEAWLGIVLAFYSDWPVSFCISALGALVYFASFAMPQRRATQSKRAAPLINPLRLPESHRARLISPVSSGSRGEG